MAAMEHRWATEETDLLIEELLNGCQVIDMRNPKQLGYFVMAVAALLSELRGERITREDVIRQFMTLEKRFYRFLRYITKTKGIEYFPDTNKVQIYGAFYTKYKTEPRYMGLMRRDGEPKFLELNRIFEEHRAGGAQWTWLLDSFQRGHVNWLRDDVPKWLVPQNVPHGETARPIRHPRGAPRRGQRQ